MHMMVCSEWAGATLPSRVAPQKFCIIMLLSQHVFCRDGSIFVSPFQAYGQARESLTMYIYSQTGDWRKGEKMENYRIYLTEEEIPTHYYNLRADMEKKPAPLLNPGTMKPMTAEELKGVFCEELVAQELDNDTRYIEIPEEIRDYYKTYRPSPVIRAYNLEKQLGTPAAIYFKFEGNNTSGSHKLNSAAA